MPQEFKTVKEVADYLRDNGWSVPKGKDPGEAFELGVDIKEWVRAGLPRGLR